MITPDDLRILIETEDEYSRRGRFRRIFPRKTRSEFLNYFETPRYHNLLLTKWIEHYEDTRSQGGFEIFFQFLIDIFKFKLFLSIETIELLLQK